MNTLVTTIAFLSNTISKILLTFIFSIILISCGSDSDGGASLAGGDLSYEVKSESGTSLILSRSYYDGEGIDFTTLNNIKIGDSGKASGDLVDGDYNGYRLQASIMGGNGPSLLTLKLLSGGEVIAKTSSPAGEGYWIAEAGKFPNMPEQ